MAQQPADNICVIIEDGDLTDDEPGPCRSVLRPSACSYEVAWFKSPFQRPSDQVVNSDIPQGCLKQFQDLIWNHPHDRMVPGYGMTPKELASVSSDGRKGWLVSSHFYWLSRCINQQQKYTRVFVLDPAIRQATLEKLFNGRAKQDIRRLIFVMCVGRQDDGLVFFGTDKMQGDHWSVAVVDLGFGTVWYCDTLGWPAPDHFLTSVVQYTSYLGLPQVSQLSIKMAHEPNLEQHLCTASCTNYPLQTCSDVCGVIAMVCIAIAALDESLFNILMKKINPDLNLYLTDPTQFSSYLRHVLIYWLVHGHIDISRISLKPGFDPLAVPDKASTCSLKRKNFSVSNGEDKHNTKRKMSNIFNGREGVTINQYILEAMATKLPSGELLSEVVELFASENAQETESAKIKKYFAHLMFNNAIERSKEDVLSTKSYFNDWKDLPNMNPIILFKGQGKELKSLSSDDAMVVIQTSFQKEMMKTYGRKCICLDFTRKSERDKFYLVTVLVFYEGTDELPVAWLLSTKYDNTVLSLFFKALKVNVGELQTEYFLGDMSGNLHKMWIQHFPKPAKKMFCMWDVLQVWNSRLETFIPNIKERQEVKNFLTVLPKITGTEAFRGYMKALLEVLKQFPSFLEYFRSKFVDDSKDEFWASCYRHISQSQYVPFQHSYGRILKLLGFYEKQRAKRLDIFHHRLLQLSRFLENKLHIEPSAVRLQTALRDLEVHHQMPLQDLDIYQSASGEEWCIRASSETNSVSIIDTGRSNCECQLKCRACQICVHRYVCTCPRYLLMASACMHVHMIHSYRKMNNALNDTGMDSSPTAHPGTAESDKGK